MVSDGEKALSLKITNVFSIENDQHSPTFVKIAPISLKSKVLKKYVQISLAKSRSFAFFKLWAITWNIRDVKAGYIWKFWSLFLLNYKK